MASAANASPAHAIRLRREIEEQPAIMASLLTEARLGFATAPQPPIHAPSAVATIGAIAEGSSFQALTWVAPYWEQWLGCPVIVRQPNTWESVLAECTPCPDNLTDDGEYDSQARSSTTAFSGSQHWQWVAVSQSGKTASILGVLERLAVARASSSDALVCFTNDETSILAQFKQHWSPAGGFTSIAVGAGVEESIAATKSFTATVVTLWLWGLQQAVVLGNLTPAEAIAWIDALTPLTTTMQPLFSKTWDDAIAHFTQQLVEVNHVVLLSRGPLATALPEAGLKLTETSSHIAMSDNTESFKHGPKVVLGGIHGQIPNVIYVVPPQQTFALKLFHDLKTHFWQQPHTPHETPLFSPARVFLVGFENSPPVPQDLQQQLAMPAGRQLTLPAVSGCAATLQAQLLTVCLFQLMSLHLAVLKGNNPDHPSLSKAVLT